MSKYIIKQEQVKEYLTNLVGEVEKIEYLQDEREWLIRVPQVNAALAIMKLQKAGIYVFHRDGQLKESLESGFIYIYFDAVRYAYDALKVHPKETGNYRFEGVEE